MSPYNRLYDASRISNIGMTVSSGRPHEPQNLHSSYAITETYNNMFGIESISSSSIWIVAIFQKPPFPQSLIEAKSTHPRVSFELMSVHATHTGKTYLFTSLA